jgi:hypothetical protein
MIKFFFSLLFAISTISHAEAPPVSVKGQQGSKLLPKWNFQLPNNQATNLGGIDALLETGNENQLANPGFEAATTMQGWTLGTGVTQTSVLAGGFTFPGGGKKTPILNLASVASGATVLSQSITQVNPGLYAGNTYIATIWIQQTTNFYSLCGMIDATEQNCTAIPHAVGTADLQRVSVLITPTTATQTITLKIKATGAVASDTIALDNAFLGVAPISGAGMTSSGSGEVLNRAYVSCNTTSLIFSQSGTWMSSAGAVSGGACTYNIAAGTYSLAPACTANFADASTVSTVSLNITTSTTGVTVRCTVNNSNCGAGWGIYLMCQGPK